MQESLSLQAPQTATIGGWNNSMGAGIPSLQSAGNSIPKRQQGGSASNAYQMSLAPGHVAASECSDRLHQRQTSRSGTGHNPHASAARPGTSRHDYGHDDASAVPIQHQPGGSSTAAAADCCLDTRPPLRTIWEPGGLRQPWQQLATPAREDAATGRHSADPHVPVSHAAMPKVPVSDSIHPAEEPVTEDWGGSTVEQCCSPGLLPWDDWQPDIPVATPEHGGDRSSWGNGWASPAAAARDLVDLAGGAQRQHPDEAEHSDQDDFVDGESEAAALDPNGPSLIQCKTVNEGILLDRCIMCNSPTQCPQSMCHDITNVQYEECLGGPVYATRSRDDHPGPAVLHWEPVPVLKLLLTCEWACAGLL